MKTKAKMNTKTKTKTKMKIKKTKTKTKMKIKMKSFDAFVNSTLPRDAIDGHLPLFGLELP